MNPAVQVSGKPAESARAMARMQASEKPAQDRDKANAAEGLQWGAGAISAGHTVKGQSLAAG